MSTSQNPLSNLESTPFICARAGKDSIGLLNLTHFMSPGQVKQLRDEWAEQVKGTALEGVRLMILPPGSAFMLVSE